jgi:hypothetical protein
MNHSQRIIVYMCDIFENDSIKIIEKVNVLFTLVKMCASIKKIQYNHCRK